MKYMVIEPQLPWDYNQQDERKYWSILSILLVLSLLFSWLVASSILKEKPPRSRAEIPERFVKLVLEQKKT